MGVGCDRGNSLIIFLAEIASNHKTSSTRAAGMEDVVPLEEPDNTGCVNVIYGAMQIKENKN